MAELPDLTVFATILNKKFKGETLATLAVKEARKLNVSAAALKKALEGEQLSEVRREGKTLQFRFGNEILGLHLMLRGELTEAEDPRFLIMSFHFKNGKTFSVVDLQKQATPTLNPPPNQVPDALAIDHQTFSALLAKKRTVIKTLLMDQKLIRGIGNSYADEILYDAHISPFSIANVIPEQEKTKLFHSIGSVLKKAIKDIEEANGEELVGELKDFMMVHGAKLKKTSKGEEIKTEKIGGRSTYYTDTQELFH